MEASLYYSFEHSSLGPPILSWILHSLHHQYFSTPLHSLSHFYTPALKEQCFFNPLFPKHKHVLPNYPALFGPAEPI